MGILQLLAKENYITYHKTLARVLGVDEAILFGELCSMSNLFGDEFFCEQSKLMDDTCLTEYRVRNALKNLQSAELVEIEKKGLPARNWYVLNEEKLIEIMGCHRTSGVKFDATGDGKNDTTIPTNSNTTINNNIINKNSSSKNKSKKKKERKKNTSYDEILSSITDDSLKELYFDYIKMRQLIKAPMTDRALTMLIKKVNELEPTDVERQKRLLETAIMNNWKSVYPLKDGKENTGDGQTNGDTPNAEYDPQLGSWY